MKLKLLEEIIKAFMDMMSLTNLEEKLTSSSTVIVIVPKFSIKYDIVISHTHTHKYIDNAQTHKYTVRMTVTFPSYCSPFQVWGW